MQALLLACGLASLPHHQCRFSWLSQSVRSKYSAAFRAGLEALCGQDVSDGRQRSLLPHIYGSAEYLGDSSAGLGPPDEHVTGKLKDIIGAKSQTWRLISPCSGHGVCEPSR
jgi:hypothetical protein